MGVSFNPNNFIKTYPAFNPHMIEMAMHSRGLSINQLAANCSIEYNRMRQLIYGEEAATNREIKSLGLWLDYPKSFFEQWPESEIDWDGATLARSVPIQYRRYKVCQ